MTIPGSGSNPVTVVATTNVTTTSPSDALEDFNDSIAGKIDPGVTVDGFGLFFTSTLSTATISVENDGTIATDQNSNHALLVSAGTSGKLTYSGSGNITDTGTGGAALNVSNSGTGEIDVTISGTNTITATDSGTGVETGGSTGVVMVTVDPGGTVQAGVGIALGGTTSTNTLTNSGTVEGTGDLGIGVSGNVGWVINSGTISAPAVGGVVENVTLTNNSLAMIETAGTTAAGATLSAIVAVEALNSADITNKSGATIQATGPLGQIGILVGQAGATGNAKVDNAGTISGPLDGVNTNTSGATTITNSGSITATTRSGIRVNTATIENDKDGTSPA